MDHGNKQRVVGTLVLLALALVFLPFVLDGDGNYQPAINTRIPESPTVELMPEPVPRRPEIEADRYPQQQPQPDFQVLDEPADEPDSDQVAQPVEELAESEPTAPDLQEQEPGLDQRSLPESWSVRLGVFSNPQNAVNLEERLRNAGYRAYTRQMPAAQGMVTGVFVGPQVERLTANRLKVQLQEEFQLAGLVVRFEVESF